MAPFVFLSFKKIMIKTRSLATFAPRGLRLQARVEKRVIFSFAGSTGSLTQGQVALALALAVAGLFCKVKSTGTKNKIIKGWVAL
jgi:transketolase N-terminal domain/subunit